jgi:hypothetical protein
MNKLNEILILLLAWITAILGMLCLALGIYLIPFVFNWFHVDFLDHLIRIMPELTKASELKSIMAKLGVAIPFILGGGLFWLISRYCSNVLRRERADDDAVVNAVNVEIADRIEDEEEIAEELSQPRIHHTIKILLAILAVIVLIMFLEYMIDVFPTS